MEGACPPRPPLLGSLFIRRTQTRSTPSGQTYFTHRLVRSHRLSGKVRQQTLAPLLHPSGLCRRLDQILSQLIQGVTQLEEEAQRMAERLLEGEADVTDRPLQKTCRRWRWIRWS